MQRGDRWEQVPGVGEAAGIGFSAGYTNGSVYGLKGPANDISVSGGPGAYGSLDLSTDLTPNGSTTTMFTFGAGEGGGGSTMLTYTSIYVLTGGEYTPPSMSQRLANTFSGDATKVNLAPLARAIGFIPCH